MASFRKRGERWQARVIRKGYKPLSKTFMVRGDAEMWARGVEREMDLGIYAAEEASKELLFGEVIKRYRLEVTPLKRGADAEEWRLKAIESRPIAGLMLGKLKASDIAKYRDERLKEVSPGTVNRDLDDLSSIFSHARKEWGLDVSNLVCDIRRPPKSKSRNRLLESHEQSLLLAALKGGRNDKGQFASGGRNPWVGPLVELALETAMRRGELLSLEWRHVDLQKQLAHLPVTKNGASRTVPLSMKAIDILSRLPRDNDGRVFPITPMALRKAFERARRNAGITDFHFHDLRHTATTRLANLLPNLIELAAVTGHKDVRMLARYYHPKAEELAKKLG